MPRRRAGVLLPIEEAVLDIGIRRSAEKDPEFYGFALSEELEADGASRLLGHGTLYKALARLEAAGLLDSRWEEVDAAEQGRPRRRLYRVTAAAAPALARSRAEQGATASGRWATA